MIIKIDYMFCSPKEKNYFNVIGLFPSSSYVGVKNPRQACDPKMLASFTLITNIFWAHVGDLFVYCL
jgi:hypothetical protein